MQNIKENIELGKPIYWCEKILKILKDIPHGTDASISIKDWKPKEKIKKISAVLCHIKEVGEVYTWKQIQEQIQEEKIELKSLSDFLWRFRDKVEDYHKALSIEIKEKKRRKKIIVIDDEAQEIKGKDWFKLKGVDFGFIDTWDDDTKDGIKEADVVVLDLLFKGFDVRGMQILEEIKQIRPSLPVIILSGLKGTERVVKCIKRGADGYFRKWDAGDRDKFIHKIKDYLLPKVLFWWDSPNTWIGNLKVLLSEEFAVDEITDATPEEEREKRSKEKFKIALICRNSRDKNIEALKWEKNMSSILFLRKIHDFNVFVNSYLRLSDWIFEIPEGEKNVSLVDSTVIRCKTMELIEKGELRETPDLIGDSEKIRKIRDEEIPKAACSEMPIIIIGETGTGKEVVARKIHRISKRTKEAFISINVGALAPITGGLGLKDEIFGHIEGYFATTTRGDPGSKGIFEQADGGTLFLDEIENASPEVQEALLRVLEEKKVTKLGGETISVDFRLIVATNINLRKKIELKKFREDLFYRIFCFPIQLPPLKERKDDIPKLSEYFVEKYSKINNVHKKLKSFEVLKSYDWGGNVRELERFIEYLISTKKETEIEIREGDLENWKKMQTMEGLK